MEDQDSNAILVPGGVVTTQNISTVIRPKGNNKSLQFVKIQTPELSKTAVEQIRIAEERNISKERIKEVEEEWQNNLLNWKSKRRQQITQTFEQAPNDLYETGDSGSGRKIKTFAEMIEERAKSGNRLGFHLQRYLNADDDDEGKPLDTRETKSFIQDSDESKHRVDSDYEAHSSTSSGYNQLDSKSPSTPDAPLEMSTSANNLKFTDTSACDNRLVYPQKGGHENHSISIVGSSRSKQLNSTPKQDLKSPPVISKMKPTIDVDSNANEVSIRCEDQSEHSVSEEEEEDQEEEEQKHLQRIAFEAKLKAFEKMTKPSAQKPEIAPKRINKASPLLKPKLSSSVNLKLKERQQSTTSLQAREQLQQENFHSQRHSLCEENLEGHVNLKSVAPSFRPNIAGNLGEANLRNELERLDLSSKPTLSSKELSPSQVNKSRNEQMKMASNMAPLGGPYVQTVNLAQKIQSIDSRHFNNDLKPDMVSRLSNISLDQTSNQSTMHNSKVDCSQNFNQLNLSSGRIAPLSEQLVTPRLPYDARDQPTNQVQSRIDPLDNFLSRNDSLPDIHDPTPKYPSTHSQSNMVVQKNRHLVTQPPPDSPKSVSSQRKPMKEDKDKTVLSISGKKRCSSCKEELGRGAAAFVVESLSLVYHTNCFRCSVCHVNLSNGFRGVDVRVHAGALHCQNCYSKDGLNYSRV